MIDPDGEFKRPTAWANRHGGWGLNVGITPLSHKDMEMMDARSEGRGTIGEIKTEQDAAIGSNGRQLTEFVEENQAVALPDTVRTMNELGGAHDAGTYPGSVSDALAWGELTEAQKDALPTWWTCRTLPTWFPSFDEDMRGRV